MVDTLKIAIADLLKHPELGIVSYQPDLTEPISDRLRVRDRQGYIHYVLASECDYPGDGETEGYWRNFPEEVPDEDRI